MKKNDSFFMRKALIEAQKALEIGEVPVGAVIVKDNKIIAKGHNRCIKDNDPSAHAEIIAL
ncbi:MAG: nucleoside deaminase, partial [Elusimicrobiota bacterium]|nr:nucleoside deaminase [Elusimicrobiota bacterium]